MDEATQALLADVPGIDRNDPAIQAALAVMRLEKPQAPRPSAEPPWLLKDLTETIASFLCPVDALALDASGSATRCVLVEGIVDGRVLVKFLGARDKGNLANTYQNLGRFDETLSMRRDVYSGRLKLNGEEDEVTLRAANNYAATLKDLEHFEEAKSLLRESIPVARRILGDSNDITIKLRINYASALYEDPAATLDDLREAVTRFEDLSRDGRRVLGSSHPLVEGAIERELQMAREALRARGTPSEAAV